jgi:alpha,alpha-trehalase
VKSAKISRNSLNLLIRRITGSTKASIAGIPEDVHTTMGLSFGWAPHQMLLWEGLISMGILIKLRK